MTFLGIGPGELLLILIVLLIVVGPEQLPGLARQLGRVLVRLRNWVQTSPDAALVLRAHAEFEQELAQLKASLLDVQSVRDEVLGAARQFNEAVSPLITARPSLNDLLSPSSTRPQAASATGPAGVSPLTVDALDAAMPDSPAAAPAVSVLEISASAPDPSWTAQGDEAERPAPIAAQPAPTAGEIEQFSLRLQALTADLYALQEQLKQCGLFDPAWQPHSCTTPLPAQQPGKDSAGRETRHYADVLDRPAG